MDIIPPPQSPPPKRRDSVGSEDSGLGDSRPSSPDGSVKSFSPDTQIPDADQSYDASSPPEAKVHSRDISTATQNKTPQNSVGTDHIEGMEFEETGDLTVYFDATEMVTSEPEPPGGSVKKVTNDRAAKRLETSLRYCEEREDIPESFSNLLRGVFQKAEYQETLASLLERDKNAVESLIQWLHVEWSFYQDRVTEAKGYLKEHIQDISSNEAQRLDMFLRNMDDNIGEIIETELVNNLQIFIASNSDYSEQVRGITAEQILNEVPWGSVKTYQNEFVAAYLKSLPQFEDDESHPMGRKTVPGVEVTMLQMKTNPYIGALMNKFTT